MLRKKNVTEICKTSDEMQRIRKRMRDEREEMTTATKGFDYTTKILLLLKGNPHATGEDKQKKPVRIYYITRRNVWPAALG